MKSAARSLILIGGALAALQLAGCAALVNGNRQPLSVQAMSDLGYPVAGANCTLTNDKGTWFVTSPGSTVVNRSYGDMAVTCDRPPGGTGTTVVKSSTTGAMVGNIFFGGLIGAGVDMASGAGYDYPSLIRVNMMGVPPPVLTPCAWRDTHPWACN